MAHHLAGRLNALDHLSGDTLVAAQDDVASLVLQLWQHRRQLEFQAEPLAALERVERTLERLDPQRPSWGYHTAFGARGVAPPGAEGDDLLQAVEELDRCSDDLVRSVVQHEAAIAAAHDAPWITAAIDANADTPRWLQRVLAGDTTAAAATPTHERITRAAEETIAASHRILAILREQTPPGPELDDGAAPPRTTRRRRRPFTE